LTEKQRFETIALNDCKRPSYPHSAKGGPILGKSHEKYRFK
jgi:hypothetical protein